MAHILQRIVAGQQRKYKTIINLPQPSLKLEMLKSHYIFGRILLAYRQRH
nr:MAG TPA_asm: hypothetical protein [Caudoviricetes sp.]DAN21373.1 MAG TPA_asm: hypothetical protein [Bacteriophage sp.]DAP24376.1 MAG TPA: hypothetical protein [Caudoviricetes sp.]DAR43536.1 MAG TPA: hypothetical protein [Caudoviricetes sp.]DAZ58504.1 MAG TPA: hypothetical protein [Caudoviricetes sp.]